MAWTTTALASALDANRADRTPAQQEVVDIAARMFLEFLNAQTAHGAAVRPVGKEPASAADTLADAALRVVRLCLHSDEFVPRGTVTFAAMDLQAALYAYRSLKPAPPMGAL